MATKTSNFRLSDQTLADLDAIAARVGGSRTEAIRYAAEYCRAAGCPPVQLTPGSEPARPAADGPPHRPAVAAEDDGPTSDTSDLNDAPRPEETPRPASQVRRNLQPVATCVGPVTSLRRVPIKVPDLPNVHRLLNPVTRARYGHDGGCQS